MVHTYGDFFQRPDEPIVFSVLLMTAKYGGGRMLIRSHDGGKTWGDVTCQFPSLNACACSHSVNLNNLDHILTMARTQWKLLDGEDLATVRNRTGCPGDAVWIYKQGVMIESIDDVRSFKKFPAA